MSTLSIGSLIKGKASEQPPEKSEHVQVCESLMMELDYQMQEAEQQSRDRQKEEKRKETGVDYSWLIATPQKMYEMPQLERLQLEELCLKVKATECSRVIGMFRDSLLRQPTVQEMPRLLRSVVLHVLDGRPKEDTMSEWMMKSLTKLKPTSSRVMPISDPENVELQRGTGSGPMPVYGNNGNSAESSRNGETRLFQSVDSLPV